MRSRSNSGVRLDYFHRVVEKTVLKYQHPATGLLRSTEENSHSWVRDNVYAILSVWGLSLAYRKTADLDEDRSKSYELEQAVVKLMRGLLCSMMMQVDKLESFKCTQNPEDALHAKYCSISGKTVVGDNDWGHLQIDATSLFILTLAQMTASGLQIVYTLDEVAFVQNLVFYIETAYRTPDYGIWERGDKTNHGLPEINSSSIGMAVAALEGINELDLFGARGGPASVIHVLPDEAQQCQAILHSMLPRESSSKEIDAGLMNVISYPAFAVDDMDLIVETRQTIEQKLVGKYGCSRFLRDGHKTAREDPNRLHYEPWELQIFDKIECQWPMFFAYFILDALFKGDKEQLDNYRSKLESVIVKKEDGIPLVPEMYMVPADKVDLEYKHPNSQKRLPIGKSPHKWGQSMYILSRLIDEGFLSPGELDPLNRRLVAEPRPDVVVQVVILAEDIYIQDKLAQHGIEVQTITEVAPILVYPARVLSQIYSLLGKNKRLGLTGRPSSEIGLLATSKLYMLGDQILAFVPQFMDQNQFYCTMEAEFLVDFLRTEVVYLKSSWKGVGRPIITINLTHMLIGRAEDHYQSPSTALIATIKKLRSGYIQGTRVHLGNLSDFLTTSCVTKLSFVKDPDNPGSTAEQQVMSFIDDLMSPSCPRSRLLSGSKKSKRRLVRTKSGSKNVRGIIRRSRSIAVDAESTPDMYKQLKEFRARYAAQNPSSSQDSKEDQEPTTPTSPTSPGIVNPPSLFYLESGIAEESPISFWADQRKNREHGSHNVIKEEDEIGGDIGHFLHLKSTGHAEKYSPNHTPVGTPTHSPEESPVQHRKKLISDNERVDIDDLLQDLHKTENLQDQGDIIHYLYMEKGIDWEYCFMNKRGTVKELLVELYEKSGHWKQWWLIRHTAGMLKKRVEELALAATDLLVRQKQLSVGMPPEREKTILVPLPPDELAAIIYECCGEDLSLAALTQELLIYLAMFIRTEPKLFHEMLRLRVGLIIQVMASELARTLKCTGEEASDHLLNLSPFEMKTLLHHILSGKEFTIGTVHADEDEEDYRYCVRTKEKREEAKSFAKLSIHTNKLNKQSTLPMIISTSEDEVDDESTDRQGQWLRRRRLDGALNRVPLGFYPRIWKVLERCHGLSIEGHLLPQSLTREMTPGELKFAIQVEMVLNKIPQPEYRQLMVEALMVLALLVENDGRKVDMNHVIHVDKLVKEANNIFINDQQIPKDVASQCIGAADVCQHFYDSAPSGRYGTMCYLCRAMANTLQLPVGNDDTIECVMS